MNYALIKRDGKAIGVVESDPQGLGVLTWFHHNVHAYSMDHATTHEGYSVDTVDSVDCHDVAGLIEGIAARAGVTMSAAFVPLSQSRNAKPGADGKIWRSLNWRVAFQVHERPAFLATDYSQGEAYSPAHKWKAETDYDRWAKSDAIDLECETGKEARRPWGNGSKAIAGHKPIAAPPIGDVLQALARDSDVLDYAGFEQWALEFGYDTDSRAAESIYRQCVDLALQLKRGLGEHLLSEIRLAAQFN